MRRNSREEEHAAEERPVELWLDLDRDLVVQRIEPRGGEEVPELVEGDADVEGDRHEERRDQRLPADEDESQDLALKMAAAGSASTDEMKATWNETRMWLAMTQPSWSRGRGIWFASRTTNANVAWR